MAKMYLYREISVIRVYFLVFVLYTAVYYSYAEDNFKKTSVKSMIVREIMKKVSNVTLNSLSQIPNDKKEGVLNKIELKLKKAAEGLTDGNKYVNFIMQQFRNRAYDSKENGTRYYKKAMDSINDKTHTTEANVINTTESELNRKVFDPKSKEHIIMDIANKIESLAKRYLRDSQTLDQKKEILKKIEQRIIESSKRRHMQIHSQHDELKAYTELITQGLELSIRRLLLPSTRRTDNIELANQTSMKNDIINNNTLLHNMEQINKYKKLFTEIWNKTLVDFHCADKIEDICYRFHSVNRLACGDGKIVMLENLCDGISDCWNQADESNCTDQAILKIKQTSILMSDVDEFVNSKCTEATINGYEDYINHHNMLLAMLTSQMNYMKTYKAPKLLALDSGTQKDSEIIFMRKMIADTTMTLNSLAFALQINFCPPNNNTIYPNNITRKSMTYEEKENESDKQQNAWTAKSCMCWNGNCKHSPCDNRCKRICQQKFSLVNWACLSTSDNAFIPLDFICDGKLDCFDESDETLCTTDLAVSKYSANNLYKDIIDILTLKSLSLEYSSSRNKVVALTTFVRQLQKASTNHVADSYAVKLLRDKCFTLLVNVFDDMLQTSNLKQLDNVYNLLLLVNEKLIEAMKYSNTGNENLIPSASCFCRNGTCPVLRCSDKCKATCRVQPILTKFSCNVNNVSVDVKDVCDGKNECPNAEDEKDCKNEVCRSHHLVVLRHNLEKAGKKLQDSVVGEIVDAWKTKVVAYLKIAITNDRPNHKILEDITSKVLHDLVTAYAKIEGTRRGNGDNTVKEFKYISEVVMQTLKSCRK